MIQLEAKATNATMDNPTDVVAISGNLSLPQLDCQSSTLVAADEEADRRRYAIICNRRRLSSISSSLSANVAKLKY